MLATPRLFTVIRSNTNVLNVPSRNFSWLEKAASQYRNAMGYRRFGLKAHDLLAATPSVKEALRRLDPKEAEERYRRLRVALDLSTKHDVLSEETDANADYGNEFYLTELLEEVRAEESAREAFRNQN